MANEMGNRSAQYFGYAQSVEDSVGALIEVIQRLDKTLSENTYKNAKGIASLKDTTSRVTESLNAVNKGLNQIKSAKSSQDLIYGSSNIRRQTQKGGALNTQGSVQELIRGLNATNRKELKIIAGELSKQYDKTIREVVSHSEVKSSKMKTKDIETIVSKFMDSNESTIKQIIKSTGKSQSTIEHGLFRTAVATLGAGGSRDRQTVKQYSDYYASKGWELPNYSVDYSSIMGENLEDILEKSLVSTLDHLTGGSGKGKSAKSAVVNKVKQQAKRARTLSGKRPVYIDNVKPEYLGPEHSVLSSLTFGKSSNAEGYSKISWPTESPLDMIKGVWSSKSVASGKMDFNNPIGDAVWERLWGKNKPGGKGISDKIFGGLDKGMQGILKHGKAIFKVAEAVAKIVAGVLKGIGESAKAVGDVGGALMSFDLNNPVGSVTNGIAGVGGGLVGGVSAMGQTTSGIPILGGIIGGVTGAVSQYLGASLKIGTSLLSTIVGMMKKIVNTSPVFKTIMEILDLAFTMFFMPAMTLLANELMPEVTKLLDWAVEAGNRFTEAFKNAFGDEDMGTIFNDVFSSLIDFVENNMDSIAEFVKEGIKLFPDLLQNVVEWAKLFIDNKDQIFDLIRSLLDMFTNVLNPENFQKLIDFANDGIDFLEKNADDILDAMIAMGSFAKAMMPVVSAMAKFFGATSSSSLVPESDNAKAAVSTRSGISLTNTITTLSQAKKGYNKLKGWLGFAKGGYVPATPGGIPAIVGEGGEGEYIIPESRMNVGPTIVFNAPVYGMSDFKQQVRSVMNEYSTKSVFR